MNILLTGATGFIGQELREELLKEGHSLVVITRNPKKYEDESASNQKFISLEDDLTAEMNRCDAVINLAGENLFGQRWNEEVKRKIYESRIFTTRILVKAMERAEHKPAVFISASASGIYGDKGEELLDESALLADDFLASLCVDWEAEAQIAAEFGIRVVLPRIGVVLQQGGGALKQMLPPFSFFVGGPVGSGKQYLPWIHRTDMVHAIMFPLQNEEITGPYNACAPNPVTMSEFAKTLGRTMNRPSLFRVPEFVLRLVLGESAKPVLSSARMEPYKLKQYGFKFMFEELDLALADII